MNNIYRKNQQETLEAFINRCKFLFVLEANNPKGNLYDVYSNPNLSDILIIKNNPVNKIIITEINDNIMTGYGVDTSNNMIVSDPLYRNVNDTFLINNYKIVTEYNYQFNFYINNKTFCSDVNYQTIIKTEQETLIKKQYNDLNSKYNKLGSKYNNLIKQYNDLVKQYNSLIPQNQPKSFLDNTFFFVSMPLPF